MYKALCNPINSPRNMDEWGLLTQELLIASCSLNGFRNEAASVCLEVLRNKYIGENGFFQSSSQSA